eukprot:CAMPEP_0118901870 /NCGR_PEP_ID=MMETSP1166-20130328/7405_1 /TAXON_ID=1104430 /ORGANISM="Chrysoreinhardia sp, Strain CCMP3193" /LENGTH=133 /DNA_ID=CAMNT_0006841059 /DNA_START=72 /DNA_END=470 /DNA_ORIENTATION=-
MLRSEAASVLGVDVDAEKQEIRSAYRKMSLRLHPDKNKDDDATQKFQELTQAYERLLDDRSDDEEEWTDDDDDDDDPGFDDDFLSQVFAEVFGRGGPPPFFARRGPGGGFSFVFPGGGAFRGGGGRGFRRSTA